MAVVLAGTTGLGGSGRMEATEPKPRPECKPGLFDNLFLHLFRSKMETGWDSGKPGYEGLIEVANRLMIGRTNSEAKEASIRVLRSLFPPLILELYRILVAPLAGGRVAAEMVARVTALTCKWLMGPCEVNTVDLPHGTSWTSGVFVERCKYLEESKCVGICMNTCKLPTQAFYVPSCASNSTKQFICYLFCGLEVLTITEFMRFIYRLSSKITWE